MLFTNSKYPEKLSKYNAEMSKILQYQKTSKKEQKKPNLHRCKNGKIFQAKTRIILIIFGLFSIGSRPVEKISHIWKCQCN